MNPKTEGGKGSHGAGNAGGSAGRECGEGVKKWALVRRSQSGPGGVWNLGCVVGVLGLGLRLLGCEVRSEGWWWLGRPQNGWRRGCAYKVAVVVGPGSDAALGDEWGAQRSGRKGGRGEGGVGEGDSYAAERVEHLGRGPLSYRQEPVWPGSKWLLSKTVWL